MKDDGTNGIRIGIGVLSWPASERRSDRYGTVTLADQVPNYDDICPDCHDLWLDGSPQGLWGHLVAHVLETRESGHIGDLFRGLSPQKPTEGEWIILGEGHFFHAETTYGSDSVGVEPDRAKPRETDWLDPKALYRAHDQTVELWFIPKDGVINLGLGQQPATVDDSAMMEKLKVTLERGI